MSMYRTWRADTKDREIPTVKAQEDIFCPYLSQSTRTVISINNDKMSSQITNNIPIRTWLSSRYVTLIKELHECGNVNNRRRINRDKTGSVVASEAELRRTWINNFHVTERFSAPRQHDRHDVHYGKEEHATVTVESLLRAAFKRIRTLEARRPCQHQEPQKFQRTLSADLNLP